ncbi:MAG TPA: YsnF/AvaK domain-containing protein [Nitrososphaeraceae archaeon]|nr:YsnF/AvaK domain-containing protein [Nitrososphaeraceae archaeon]
MLEGSSYNGNIDWDDVIKKEARGINDEDLGEVQEVTQDYVMVQKGLINKEKYYVPQNEVESYDGNILRFKLSEEEIKSKYLGDSPPLTRNTEKDDEEESESTRVSLVEERLNISKRDVTYKEATLIKEPVTETKTVEVPITHEELVVERRPASKSTTSTSDLKPPVTSKEEIKIPLKKEEVEVKKEPYVKEEVVLKKKRVAETKTITEEVKSERLADTSGIDVE